MNGDENAAVKALLTRVAEEAGPSRGSDQAVYGRAARLRWRRRAALTAVGAVVVTGVPVFLANGAGPQGAGPAASTGRAAELAKLLPAGVGKIEEVSWPDGPKPVGPLDGHYAVRRDGGVGHLTVTVMTPEEVDAKEGLPEDFCAPGAGNTPPDDCTSERLPNGRGLSIWQETDAKVLWGERFTAWLNLPDGGVLTISDAEGFLGEGRRLGPLLDAPPLTRTQLRDLALRPELLPS